MTPVIRLSKSKVMSALQCPKRLHLEVTQPELKLFSRQTEAIFAVGHEVGAIAREVLGVEGGVLVDRELGVQATLQLTQELMEREVPCIYEAAFQHDNVLVYVDLLRREPDGWRMVEVKSSTSIKPEHRLDCAIQSWVFQGCGHRLSGVSLAHVDNTFVYAGESDYRRLLIENDITLDVLGLLSSVSGWVEDAAEAARVAPVGVEVGIHCSAPYECPFRGHCWPSETKHPVHGLGGRKGVLAELVRAGCKDIRDVDESQLQSDVQKRILRVTKSCRPELLAEAVRIARDLPYPRYYLDFETVGSAIPIWPGTRPYEALPFQWSCHLEEAPGVLRHAEFLNVSGAPPMRELAETLLDTLGDQGPILTYSSYERRILNGLAERFPDFAVRIATLSPRVVDLLPITKRNYYHPDMLGSWSIKAVLPTVAPDMCYAELDEVQDGTAAAVAFMEAINRATDEARREHLRQRLLAYCRFDTEAMVRLLHFFASGRDRRGSIQEAS